MLIKTTLYKLDKEGFFIDYEDVEVEFNPETKEITNIPKGYAIESWMQQNPKQRWFKPKFIHGRWVESLTEEEIQEHDSKLESKSKEETDLEKQILELQNIIVEEKYNNLMGGVK